MPRRTTPVIFSASAGAVVSDVFIQFLGLAATVVLLPPVVWAWHLVFAEPTRFSRRALVSWIGGTLTAATALATLPVTANWALPTGLGGVSGDLLMRVPSLLLSADSTGTAVTLLFIGLTLFSVFLTLRACGIAIWRKDESRASALARNEAAQASGATAWHEEFGDEDDFDAPEDGNEEAGRMTLFLGVLAHVGLRIGGTLRRHARNMISRAFYNEKPSQIGDDGRVEPLFDNDTDVFRGLGLGRGRRRRRGRGQRGGGQ